MKDQAYDLHSAIALKAQTTADYLRERRRDNGNSVLSAEVYDYVTTELADIKRFAIRAHEIVSGQYDGLDPSLVRDSLAAIDNANALMRASRPVSEFLAQARIRIDAMKAGIEAAQDGAQVAALQHDLEVFIDEARAEFDRLMEQMQRNISH